MFSNQTLTSGPLWARAGVLACIAAVTGCASKTAAVVESEASVPVAAVVEEAPLPPDMTATEAATVTDGSAPASTTSSEDANPLRDDAPSRYTVKRGDTLWDISNAFLKEPWLWPEIWYVNPQVENPHLIYPGDVLALAYGADGSPRIILEQGGAARLNPRLRSSPIDGPIATIPYGAIASFLSRPSLLSREEVERAPRVLAFRDEHMVGGTGHEIYVRDLNAPANARFAVVHVGDTLRDPDTNDVLGAEGIYTATARVTRPGEPAKAMLNDAARETLEGDRLLSTDRADIPVSFAVRVPPANVRGQIISVVDGVELIGPYQIVAINRGRSQGIEPGHVLAIDQAGPVVRDRVSGGERWVPASRAFTPRVQLPDERAGTMLVFKSYDRMSYGIIVGASNAIRVADRVRSP